MLHLTQAHNLRRQHVKHAAITLQALTDILDHQHIFTLIFIVMHQPVPHAGGLGIIRVTGDRTGQRLGTQQGSTPPPQPFRRRTEKGPGSIRAHQKVVALEIHPTAGGYQSDRVDRQVEMQIRCPGQHYFIELPAGNGVGCAGD